ncbi:hypothetical protein FRC10_004104, partial [Ceratobasidium sp. 414]
MQRQSDLNNKGEPVTMFRHLNHAERVDLVRAQPSRNSWAVETTGELKILPPIQVLSAIRIDGNDGPRRSMNVVAKCKTPDQHHSLAWIEECDDIISEVIPTQSTRATNYVHQGWSIVATTTLAPWISSRIARKDQPNEKGNWVTKRTIVQRLVLDIPPGDLVPVPEFETDVRAALGKPTVFEKVESLNKVFGLWGDVLPV